MAEAGEAMDWIGAEMAELSGTPVGQVQGLYVDADSGEPAWVIARLGRRRRARIVALPASTCAGAPFGVWSPRRPTRSAAPLLSIPPAPSAASTS